jgi:hypothetical protein
MSSFEIWVMSWKDPFGRFGDVIKRAGLKENQLKNIQKRRVLQETRQMPKTKFIKGQG